MRAKRNGMVHSATIKGILEFLFTTWHFPNRSLVLEMNGEFRLNKIIHGNWIFGIQVCTSVPSHQDQDIQ